MRISVKIVLHFVLEKRYESEDELYSLDQSTIIVSVDEKNCVRDLNSNVDDFLKQKSALLENLPKLMKLAANFYGYKNKLNTKLKVKCISS